MQTGEYYPKMIIQERKNKCILKVEGARLMNKKVNLPEPDSGMLCYLFANYCYRSIEKKLSFGSESGRIRFLVGTCPDPVVLRLISVSGSYKGLGRF